jgi:sugar phosphate isomerase/epimerase
MSIKSSVTVSLVPEARGGPFVFWDDLGEGCRKAKALGFDAVEIFPPSASAIDRPILRSLLGDHGLTLAAVGTGAGWIKEKLNLTLPDAADRMKARDFIKSIIDFAGEFGAPAIIGSMQGRSTDLVDPELALEYLCEALNELGEHARSEHVPLFYEPLNRYETNMATTIDAGLNVLDRLTTKNVKLLADLFHMNIEEANVAQAIEHGGRRIGHVHFVDSNRRAAGLGHTNFAPIARSLRSIDYDGYASAEAFAFPNSDEAARITIETFHRLF